LERVGFVSVEQIEKSRFEKLIFIWLVEGTASFNSMAKHPDDRFKRWILTHQGFVFRFSVSKMSTLRNISLLLLLAVSLVSLPAVSAEENWDDGYQEAQADDAAGDDDAAEEYYYDNVNYDNDNSEYGAGDDYIKYWTDYAILPKRCIV
jgi:hypothetical protein